MADVDGFNVYAVIPITSTRLSELSSPERLAIIHTKTKVFEELTDRGCLVRGDDNIITVNVDISGEVENTLPSYPASRRNDPRCDNSHEKG
jgi:hypothetical protein